MSVSRKVAPLPNLGTGDHGRGTQSMNNLFFRLYLAAQSLLGREDGQGLAEYALTFTVIALGTIAGESAVAQQVNHTFIAITPTITAGIA